VQKKKHLEKKKHLALALMLMVAIVMVASLAAPPSDAGTDGSGAVHVVGRARPSIRVTVVGGGHDGCLLVRANTGWIVVMDETVAGRARIRRLFQGDKTGDKGFRIPLAGRLDDFSAMPRP